MSNEKTLDISWSTIIKIGIAFLGFYLLYLVRDVLIWIVFALIISVLFEPVISFCQKRKIPRPIAVIIVYIAIFGVLGYSIFLIAPVFVAEIQQFSLFFPQYFEKLSPPLTGLGIEAFKNIETFNQALGDWLINASADIFSALAAIFGGIFSTLTILAIALFLSIEEKGIEKAVLLLSPKRHEAYILGLWKRSQRKVAGWFGARLLACLFVGLATFLACYILDIKYALSFGFLAGVLNIIVLLGPIIAGFIIVVFTVLDSFLKALFILIAFILIQQIDGNILTPILTKKFIGLPPVLVLIAVIVGAKLWGILGAILAIPLFGVCFEFLRDFLRKQKEESIEAEN